MSDLSRPITRVHVRVRRDPQGREFLWHTEMTAHGQILRRALIEKATGEVLDDAWTDHAGRVRCTSVVERTLGVLAAFLAAHCGQTAARRAA
jgi:hypothetical protein